MNFEEILRTGVKFPLSAKLFIILFVIQIVLSLPSVFLTEYTIMNPLLLTQFAGPLIVYSIIALIIKFSVYGVYIENAGAYKNGKYEQLGKSLKRFKTKYWRFLASAILVYIIVTVIIAAFSGLAVLGYSLGSIALVIVSGIIGIVGGILAAFFLFLSPLFVVFKKSKAVESLRKSCRTIKRNKLNTLIFWLTAGIISYVISTIGSIPIIISIATTPTTGELALYNIFQNLLGTYATLFFIGALVKFFKELK